MTTITAGGTPLYMAPELLDPEKFGERSSRPTKPADMYAFGMVIYEVLTGLDPFHDKKNVAVLSLIRLIVDGARPAKPRDVEKLGFGSGTWNLVKQCWKRDSERRPEIGPLLTHFACISGSPMAPNLVSQTTRTNSVDSKKFGVARMFLSNCKRIYFLARGLIRPPLLTPTMYSSPGSTRLPLGIVRFLSD